MQTYTLDFPTRIQPIWFNSDKLLTPLPMRAVVIAIVIALHLAVFTAWQPMTPPTPLREMKITIAMSLPATEPTQDFSPPAPLSPPPVPEKSLAKIPPQSPLEPRPEQLPTEKSAQLDAPASASEAPVLAAPTQQRNSILAPPDVISSALFDADYLQNPTPKYPIMSRKLQEEGKVLLEVNVTATGTAERVLIKQGSGYSRLDQAALNTVRHWRFIPARRGDEAIASSVVVPIVFKLDS